MKAAIRKPELLKMVPLSEYAIDKLEREGDFPKRFPIASRAVVWNRDEVEEWLDNRQQNPEAVKRDPYLSKKNEKNPNHIKARERAEAHAGM